ncbi:MAG TPA: hypothetical protein IAD22_07745 [Candidatus Limousia pullorum]|uniref:Uncharacterized protein n=1 Tax=Candidatus Limousia pullorum TaxID=2840860 RepID=A0A9D1LZK8_9FIRM|nr:hypothetical protein [Candidatus Limousia pullorum]
MNKSKQPPQSSKNRVQSKINNEEATLDKEIASFIDMVSFYETKNASDLEWGYKDPYVTQEQQNRDEQITELLTQYVQCYRNKVKQTRVYRWIIIIPSIAIIVSFAAVLIYFVCKIANSGKDLDMSNLVAFITSCISFVSLVIGLLKIITKYFFPENEEQYITTIVESIQKNDLENKKENSKNTKNTNFSTDD